MVDCSRIPGAHPDDQNLTRQVRNVVACQIEVRKEFLSKIINIAVLFGCHHLSHILNFHVDLLICKSELLKSHLRPSN